MKKLRKIPENSIRRLPRYWRQLTEMEAQGILRVSSSELGALIGFTASQIRQDLNYFGSFGHQGYGYGVSELKNKIGALLGINIHLSAVVVGVGRIGYALINNFDFRQYGICVQAAFDSDARKIGRVQNGISIFDVASIPMFLNDNKVDIAVLCVPESEAQDLTQILESNGVQAIWNFTNVDISISHKTIVENVHFSDSLLTISYYIATR